MPGTGLFLRSLTLRWWEGRRVPGHFGVLQRLEKFGFWHFLTSIFGFPRTPLPDRNPQPSVDWSRPGSKKKPGRGSIGRPRTPTARCGERRPFGGARAPTRQQRQIGASNNDRGRVGWNTFVAFLKNVCDTQTEEPGKVNR